MSEPPEPSPGAWAHFRAAFVALHLLAIVLKAAPSPEGGMSRSAWADPTVQDELHVWAERVRSLGVRMDDAEFQERLWTTGRTVVRVRKRVLAPLAPYYELLGTQQGWRMFVAPHLYPSRLHIDLEEQGAWRPLYVARSPEARWRAGQLDHSRMRSVIFRTAWPAYHVAWNDLGRWLAREAAADFPQGSRIRLRYWKQRTASPAEVRRGVEPAGRWVHEQLHELAPLRTEPSP